MACVYTKQFANSQIKYDKIKAKDLETEESKTEQYLTDLTNDFVDRALKEFNLKYNKTDTRDVKMGYSQFPTKTIRVWFTYKDREIYFEYNPWFRDTSLQVIEPTKGTLGYYGWAISLFGNKGAIAELKDKISKL